MPRMTPSKATGDPHHDTHGPARTPKSAGADQRGGKVVPPTKGKKD